MEQIKFSTTQYLQDLAKLVNIDSGSNSPAGVAAVAEFFDQKYREMGWQVTKQQFDSSVGPCLEITNQAAAQFDLLLLGHIDTVFPVGTARERPFTIKDGHAYGPGVNDMKAGVLLMYYALRVLHTQAALGDKAICVALNSDEEIGSAFSRPWIEKLAQKSKYVFVLEPARANGALVKERKGVGRYQLEFTGVASHSGVDHQKGKSAINELGHWIISLHGLTDYQLGTTVNVGLVSGGTATNVVAEHAEAKVDLRITDMEELQRVEATIRKLVEQPKTPGVKVHVTGGVQRPPMNAGDATEKLCALVEEIGKRVNVAVKWAKTGGGSDGNFSAALGIPTIDGLGPIGGGSHSVDEYLVIESIEPRFKLLTELIKRI